MRVLLVCPYDPNRHGGVQRHIHALAKALASHGHETLILAPGGAAAPKLGLRRIGRMRSIAFAGTRFEISWASKEDISGLQRELDAWRPDIAHFHTLWDPLMPYQVFREIVAPRVATFHDTPPAGLMGTALKTLFKPLSRYLLGQLDGAIAVSEAPLGHLRPGRNAAVPVILPPAIDLSPFFAITKTQTSRPRILFLGRLEPRKGIHVLLDAFTLLARGDIPLTRTTAPPQLVLAGDGDLLPAVLARRAQLGDQWITHVPAPSHERQLSLLAEAALAVSPALYGESFGIVLAEALATGTPIAAAANAGYRTVLTGTGEALLVPPGDAPALARKLATLLASPAECEHLAKWGRQHARQYDIAARIGDFESVYRDAIARHQRSKEDG
ncbi:MAG: glycosyltransferase family 4 protein [Aestuariivirga sp.]|uniref:glycosyltransferase family 4 protein n=1 Tax=Aestuariivirga sp. TaxID=2650926 RepID=UPI0038CFB8FD